MLCQSFPNLLFFHTFLWGKHVFIHIWMYAFFLFQTMCLSTLGTIPSTDLQLFFYFFLHTKEMWKAATCQIKAELRCRKKKKPGFFWKKFSRNMIVSPLITFVFFIFSKLISIHSILSVFIMYLLLPFPDLSPWETLHDLVALTQHDLAKLKPNEK